MKKRGDLHSAMLVRSVGLLIAREKTTSRVILPRALFSVPVYYRPRSTLSLYSYGRRWLSVSAAVHVSKETPSFPEYGPGDAAAEVLETSAKARWAADAANIPELAPQGDLASLGLGGYSPVGLLQTILDFLHQSGVPWWAAIAGVTIALRLAMFPLVIKLQANAVRMNNIRPELEKLTEKIKQHKQAGNDLLANQVLAEMQHLYAKNNCHPVKMLGMPLIQVPVFISFFLALRRMAGVPLESMKDGGLWWFTDLTVPDPLYILPLLGCASFMGILEVRW